MQRKIKKMLSQTIPLVLLCILLPACGKKESPAPQQQNNSQRSENILKTNPGEANAPRKKVILPGLEGGALKIQKTPGFSEEQPEEIPQIEVDNRQIRTMEKNPDGSAPELHGGGLTTTRRQNWEKRTPLPADSLAAKISGKEGKTSLQWVPTRIPGSVYGTRLPDLALSNDQSVFAFVETTGKEDGPFGSRIVLMNAHSWTVIRIIETERQIIKVCFAGNTMNLAAVCKKQDELKQFAGLAVFHLKSGKEVSFRKLPESLCGQMLSDRSGRIYLGDKAKTELRRFQLPDETNEPQIIAVDEVDPVLALSPNGKLLAVGGTNGRINLYKISDMRPISTVNIPKGYPLSQIIFIDNNKSFICAAKPDSNTPSFVLRANQVFHLQGYSSGFNSITPDGKTLIHAKKVNGELEMLNPVSLQQEDRVIPDSIQPVTRGGDPQFVFFLEANRTFAVLDSKGNFYLLYHPKREKKFQKETIFMPGSGS